MISFTISNKSAIKHCITLIFIVLFLRAGSVVSAQSLVERLGGVTTDFVIATDYLTFQVASQAIIKRGVNNTKTARYEEDYGYGYGYGLQTWHLEFTTSGKIVEYYKKTREIKADLLQITDQDNKNVLHSRFDNSSDVKYYELKFTGENDKMLLKIGLSESEVRSVFNGEQYTYSINLKKIPIILLDKTKHIHIISIRNYKKK